MQKIFKIWLICILLLSLVAIFIVDHSSVVFGLIILPTAVVTAIIIILGYFTERK